MKKNIRVVYGSPSAFSDSSGSITPDVAFREYKNGTPFNVNFGAVFIPPEIMTAILEFKLLPEQARTAFIVAMTSGDAKAVSQLLKLYDYVLKMNIPIEDFNNTNEGNVMIEQPDHPRTTYTVLEWCHTLGYQLDHWRDCWYRDHLRTEMDPTSKKEEKFKLDKTIREWANLEKEIYTKVSPEQKRMYSKRRKLIAEWDLEQYGRLPAGYFIMLNSVFDWIPSAYSDLAGDDEELFWLPDEDNTSAYSIPPLSEI